MKRPMLFFALTLMAFGCTEDQEVCEAPQPEAAATSYVFQERAAGLPDNPALEIARPARLASVGELTPLDQYLGSSFKFNSSILADPENFVLRIIDCDRLAADHLDYVKTHGILENNSFSYAYTSEQSFMEKSNVTKKFSTGFSLNFGLFKIGRKKTIEEVFSSSWENNTEDAFGELSIEIRHAMYYLTATPYVNRLIAGEYLRPDFIYILYNNPIDRTLEDFGPFVTTGFFTGGRASALYYGKKYSTTVASERMKGMQKDIEASFDWKKNSTGGSLSMGNVDSESSSSSSQFESTYMNLKTYGGSKDLGVSIGSRKVDEVNIDLSRWLSSLNNTDTHRLIEIRDEGLHPLSDFLLEENFRRRIEQNQQEAMKVDRLAIPEIIVCRLPMATNPNFIQDVSILSTRQGDRIVLVDLPEKHEGNIDTGGIGGLNSGAIERADGSDLYSGLDLIAKNKSKYYKLKITVSIKRYTASDLIVLTDVSEKQMVKYINKTTGMVYLYDPKGNYAFSFPDDDHTVDVYGIRDWVEQMPEESIPMLTLESDYTIIGL